MDILSGLTLSILAAAFTPHVGRAHADWDAALTRDSSLQSTAGSSRVPTPSTYNVRMSSDGHLLTVSATLPIDGTELRMDRTRPADTNEIGAGGWPALVTNLRVTDSAGRALDVTSAGVPGWRLARPYTGMLKIEYAVDYALLAAKDWPAPREAAYADSSNFIVVGRSVFITTAAMEAITVSFDPPPGWTVRTPWQEQTRSSRVFSVGDAADLTENLIAFTRSVPEEEAANGFRLREVPTGDWVAAASEVHRVLRASTRYMTRMMAFAGNDAYLVVLLPQRETAGESYRRSFALNFESSPDSTNVAQWGNTVAHEIFHRWNGWQLHGADYASSQWFQEGVTEYVANVTMAAGGLVDANGFRAKLAEHVHDARLLSTPLDVTGGHKGAPLYSAGALVAFTWDVMIRRATAGKRNLGNVLRALVEQTGGGVRAYAWSDIEASLRASAPLDWAGFYRSYIHGGDPLPIGQTLSAAGLRLVEDGSGAPRIEEDPAATPSAHALFVALISGQ
jgi:predicted metalloprotease with PDZ domain